MQHVRVLVVDDDSNILSMMRRGLSFAGYVVDLAPDGEQALAIGQERPPDLAVLDIMLPGIDGLEVCRRLRQANASLPILMLTARDGVAERITGLDAGADDYLGKPFDFNELLARVRALLRRTHPPDTERLSFADLVLAPDTHDVWRDGRLLDLTGKEFELIEFFMRHPRQLFDRETIFNRVWGSDFIGNSNIIDVHVMRLRDKLEAGGAPRLIQTLRGAGYSLRKD